MDFGEWSAWIIFVCAIFGIVVVLIELKRARRQASAEAELAKYKEAMNKRKRRLAKIKDVSEILEGALLMLQTREPGIPSNEIFSGLYYLIRLARKAK